MYGFDVLLLPKCDVSEDATRCWHDIIKNKIQSFADPSLEKWLDDVESVQGFEAALEHVMEDLEGFSPTRGLAKLAPIARMPETARTALAARLDETFQRGFDVAEARERLRKVVKPLRQALRDCTCVGNGLRRADRLGALRAAASGVRSELEHLPAGYLIPGLATDD
jgi:hypothetical protein